MFHRNTVPEGPSIPTLPKLMLSSILSDSSKRQADFNYFQAHGSVRGMDVAAERT